VRSILSRRMPVACGSDYKYQLQSYFCNSAKSASFGIETGLALRAVLSWTETLQFGAIIMEPFAACSFLFRVTFDVGHRFMAVSAFGTKQTLILNGAPIQRRQVLAIEPFSGSGTTPVECTRLGVACLAFEVNPFLAFVGRTKLRQADPKKLRAYRQTVLKGVGRPINSRLEHISTFCEKRGRDKWLFNRDVLMTFAGGWEKIGDCPPTLRAFYRLALLRAAMDNCNAYPDGKCLRYKRLENFDLF
jgi:hypothetical protein